MENNDRGKNPVQISYISVLLYCWNHHIIMKFKCLLLMYNCWCIIPPLLLLAQHIQVAELLLNYSKYFWLNQVLLVSDSDEQSYSELQKKKKSYSLTVKMFKDVSVIFTFPLNLIWSAFNISWSFLHKVFKYSTLDIMWSNLFQGRKLKQGLLYV